MLRKISTFLTLASFSVIHQAHAQDVLENVYACAKELDPEKRLACFDKAIEKPISAKLPLTSATTLSSATTNVIEQPSTEKPSLVSTPAITNEVIEKNEEHASPKPSQALLTETKASAEKQISETSAEAEINEQAEIEQFGRPQIEEKTAFLEDGQLRTSIKSIFKSNKRKVRFELANGQIWENQESRTTGFPRKGDEVILRREALGAFYVRKANVKRSFRVKRIN